MKPLSYCIESDNESDIFGMHDFIQEEILKESDVTALLWPAVLCIPVAFVRKSFTAANKEMPYCN